MEIIRNKECYIPFSSLGLGFPYSFFFILFFPMVNFFTKLMPPFFRSRWFLPILPYATYLIIFLASAVFHDFFSFLPTSCLDGLDKLPEEPGKSNDSSLSNAPLNPYYCYLMGVSNFYLATLSIFLSNGHNPAMDIYIPTIYSTVGLMWLTDEVLGTDLAKEGDPVRHYLPLTLCSLVIVFTIRYILRGGA